MIDLPTATLRLFGGYSPSELVLPQYRSFLLERLLEEGDRADLRWLAGEVPETELRIFFRQEAGRRLSARSRVFWGLVLGETAGCEQLSGESLAGESLASERHSGSDLWPLA